jgi:hypothetical protein
VERNCLGSIYRIFDPKKIREWQYAHDRLPPPPEGEAEFLSLEQVSISRPGMESKK